MTGFGLFDFAAEPEILAPAEVAEPEFLAPDEVAEPPAGPALLAPAEVLDPDEVDPDNVLDPEPDEPRPPAAPSSRLDPVLFETGDWWDDIWQGMPEFIHTDLEPWRSIRVHFATPDDMRAFAKLVGQPLTAKTQSLWYPEAEIGHYSDKRYADGP